MANNHRVDERRAVRLDQRALLLVPFASVETQAIGLAVLGDQADDRDVLSGQRRRRRRRTRRAGIAGQPLVSPCTRHSASVANSMTRLACDRHVGRRLVGVLRTIQDRSPEVGSEVAVAVEIARREGVEVAQVLQLALRKIAPAAGTQEGTPAGNPPPPGVTSAWRCRPSRLPGPMRLRAYRCNRSRRTWKFAPGRVPGPRDERARAGLWSACRALRGHR